MMKSREFWTKANRKTKVCGIEFVEMAHGVRNLVRPHIEDLTEADSPEVHAAIRAGDPIWALKVIYQEGLDEENHFWILHTSKQEAESALQNYQIGQEIKPHDFMFVVSPKFDAENLSIYTKVSLLGRGESPHGILYQALHGAGVVGEDYRISQEVLKWIGRNGRDKLNGKFGENWELVANLEFCVVHFPETSLATLAARVFVADFIADSDYDAGYASREFEMLYSGAEQLALRAKSTRELAGVEGGNASRQRRLTNLETLILEIEKLSDAVGLISENRIVSQAFDVALERNAKMPKSKKTLEDYETALRSEEPFKARYDAVFGKNT